MGSSKCEEGEGDVLYIMWLCAHRVDWNVDGDGRDDGHVNVQRVMLSKMS